MLNLGAAKGVLDKASVLRALKPSIERLIREEINTEIDPWRLYQLRAAQRNDLYWRGLQYVVRNWLTSTAEFSPADLSSYELDAESDVPQYVQNIYRGYGMKFASVLGQRIPNVKAYPEDPTNQQMLRQTGLADVAAAILDSRWKTKIRNIELAMHLWKSSTAFAYTPYVANGFKYGHTDQPRYEQREVQVGPPTVHCLNCGFKAPVEGEPPAPCCGNPNLEQLPPQTMNVPEQVSIEHYENGMVEFHLTSIFTTRAPFDRKDLDDADWLSYGYEEQPYRLKGWYPWLRDNPPKSQNDNSSTVEATARLIRDSLASPYGASGQRQTKKWHFERFWIKPEMLEALDKAERDLAMQNFPDGVKATLIEGAIPDDEKCLENEKLTDVWAMCKPTISEKIWCDSIGHDLIPVQDLKNDVLNIAYMTFQYGSPLTFVDPRVIDPDEWNRRRAEPCSVIPVMGATGSSLQDAFFETTPSQMSNQMIPWMEGEEATGKMNVGTTEAIFGGAVPGDQQTAHEAELRKNAALQQFGLTWLNMANFWEKVKENGVRQLAKYGHGVMRDVKQSENGFSARSVDLASLAEEGWHFQADESQPVTEAEARARLIWLLANPQLSQAMGLFDPRNIERNFQLLGLQGYEVLGRDIHNKAMRVIKRLSQAEPIRKPKPDGSIETLPSIPIDEFDPHDVMAAEAVAWCMKDGLDLQENGDPGFDNVVAWGMAHYEKANPPQPPPPPQVKGAVTMAVDKIATTLGPDVAMDMVRQVNMTSDTPPPSPAPEGSAPAQKGTPSQPAPSLPPISAAVQ